MDTLKVKRLRPDAHLPERAGEGDLGYDLFAAEGVTIPPRGTAIVKTGVAVQFPDGWGGLIRDRSGMATKNRVIVSAGVIDHGYRGEIGVALNNLADTPFVVEPSMKIAQMLPMPVVDWRVEEVAALTDTARGEAGFGSTGTHKS
ncbi:MAG: dUTP diphosphatase [Nitrospinae bacterium]|nr:dUTP diphosphatase [Nitrospinota bacterium]